MQSRTKMTAEATDALKNKLPLLMWHACSPESEPCIHRAGPAPRIGPAGIAGKEDSLTLNRPSEGIAPVYYGRKNSEA